MFIWTIGDLFNLAIIGCVAVIFAAVYIPMAFKQWCCKHNAGVNETQACDAICRQCGKNLGFIGTWRDSQKATSQTVAD